MEHSPNDPLAADVRRPGTIRTAGLLLWSAFIAGLISSIPKVRGPIQGAEDASLMPYLVMVAFVDVILALVILFALRRRNWARWALLGWTAFTWASMLSIFRYTVSVSPFAAALDLFLSVAYLVACVLLFLGPGGTWFRKRSGSEARAL